MLRTLFILTVLTATALAQVPWVASDGQARADFFDYVSPDLTVSNLKVYHGSDEGAGDPLVFTFTAGRGFMPQAVKGATNQASMTKTFASWCERTGSGFKNGRLVKTEAVIRQGRTGERFTYQSGLNTCVIVVEADLFLTTVTKLPTEFTKYVIAKPQQVRSLNMTGSDFQETRLVMQFTSNGKVQFPSGPNLKTSSQADAKRFAENTECALPATRAAELVLATVPNATTNVGRLIVREEPFKNQHAYCVIVWNTDK